jgi:hypothetical protein
MTSVFEDWNSRFPRGSGEQHRVGPLGPDSVFLFQQVTSPRPSTSYFGTWHWYENAIQLKAHLLNVVMPDLSSTWLSEGALGLHVMRQPLAETLADADADWAEDLEIFQQLAESVEGASGQSNEDLAQRIQAMAQKFSARFGSTPTWDLSLTVFTSTIDAGRFLHERSPESLSGSDGGHLALDEWLALCKRSSTDLMTSAQVELAFASADEF